MASFAGTSKRRELYKATTPPWKETVRNRCFNKFRKARERLVEAFRAVPDLEEMKQRNLNLVDEVVDEEWRELYDQVPALIDMDRREILELEAEIKQELRTQRDTELERYYHSLMDLQYAEVEQRADSLRMVLCPVCKRNVLHASGSTIGCPCGLQLFSASKPLSLDRLNTGLNDGMDNHDKRHCDQGLTFAVETNVNATESFLHVYCETCHFEFCLP